MAGSGITASPRASATPSSTRMTGWCWSSTIIIPPQPAARTFHRRAPAAGRARPSTRSPRYVVKGVKASIGCGRSIAPMTSARMRERRSRKALTTPSGWAQGHRRFVPECMLNKQRRERPLIAKAVKQGKRVVRQKFGVDEDVCTGDHACIRLSGCPSLSVKAHQRSQLKDDPVAAIDNSLRRLRQLRRGRRGGGALPVALSRRRHPERRPARPACWPGCARLRVIGALQQRWREWRRIAPCLSIHDGHAERAHPSASRASISRRPTTIAPSLAMVRSGRRRAGRLDRLELARTQWPSGPGDELGARRRPAHPAPPSIMSRMIAAGRKPAGGPCCRFCRRAG